MFNNIIGNDKIKEILKKSIEAKRISHSYMFIGTEGIGKQLFAKEIAKTILCLSEKKQKAKTYCNKCKSCLEIDTNNNPDFKIIDIEEDEKSIKISQIRNMQAKIAEKPIISHNKVYIINNADTMTTEAQNCLLKTLEEPPEYITIILIGENENNFLTTIKSRCTKINFEGIQNNEIKEYLKTKEEIELDDEILELCNGSIKKAIYLNENKEIYEKIKQIVEKLDKVDVIEILNLSEIIYKSKENINEILENLNIMCVEKAKQNYKYANCIKTIEETKKRLKSNSNYDMSIDYMVFNIWRDVN